MLIKTPISLAELIDKVSILLIKEKNIKDEKKVILIKKELEFLYEVLDQHISRNKIQNYLESLLEVNTKLWNIEDNIRNCEKHKQFDQTFIDLARSVYFTNDKRSRIKLKINEEFGSEIVEIKSYEEY